MSDGFASFTVINNNLMNYFQKKEGSVHTHRKNMHALATKMFKINAIFSPEIVSEIFMRDIIHYSFDKGDIVSFSENIPRATKKRTQAPSKISFTRDVKPYTTSYLKLRNTPK